MMVAADSFSTRPFEQTASHMSTYTLPDLLKYWQLGELTAEQAVGHLLQNLLAIAQRLTEAEKRLRQLEQPPFQPKP